MTTSRTKPQDDLPLEADVVVLGAGPAGLAATWELAESGRDVVVVEAAGAPGGLCRTHEHAGFYFDQGGHRFITRNAELFEKVRGLLGEELRIRERESVIRIGGREYRYPLELGEVLRGEGISGVVRVLGSYLRARLNPKGRQAGAASDGSLESWVRSRFGGAIFERFFRDYTRKLWGVGADRISADWAGQRISQIDLKDVIWNALGRRRKPRTFAVKYCYPRRGIGQIFETLASRVQECGASFVLRSKAVRIHAGPPLVVELEGPHGTGVVRARHLISTIPLPDLVKLVRAPAEIRDSAERLSFRSLRFVNLLLDGPPVSSRTWIYVPEKEFPMTRIQFPANRSPDNCPRGKTSVQLEVPCTAGDALWRSPQEELVERCLAATRELGFDLSERLLDSFTTFARHAYPVYDHGYRVSRENVLSWVDALPAVETCGRQGRFNYMFFDRAMEHGIHAARRVLGKPTGSGTEPYRSLDGGDGGQDSLLPEEARSILERDAAGK